MWRWRPQQHSPQVGEGQPLLFRRAGVEAVGEEYRVLTVRGALGIGEAGAGADGGVAHARSDEREAEARRLWRWDAAGRRRELRREVRSELRRAPAAGRSG